MRNLSRRRVRSILDDPKSAAMIVGVLVERLGGSVSITEREINAFVRTNMLRERGEASCEIPFVNFTIENHDAT